jgi:hypothetical protein
VVYVHRIFLRRADKPGEKVSRKLTKTLMFFRSKHRTSLSSLTYSCKPPWSNRHSPSRKLGSWRSSQRATVCGPTGIHSNDICLFKSICADSFGISGLGISTDYQWNVEFAQDAARTSYQAPWEVIYGLHRRCPGRMRRTTKLKPYQQEIYAETHTRVLRCLWIGIYGMTRYY